MENNERKTPKDMENMRQQFQNMSTPPKPKDDRKSVNLTKKQKQKRAAKRRLHCTYYKKRGMLYQSVTRRRRTRKGQTTQLHAPHYTITEATGATAKLRSNQCSTSTSPIPSIYPSSAILGYSAIPITYRTYSNYTSSV